MLRAHIMTFHPIIQVRREIIVIYCYIMSNNCFVTIANTQEQSCSRDELSHDKSQCALKVNSHREGKVNLYRVWVHWYVILPQTPTQNHAHFLHLIPTYVGIMFGKGRNPMFFGLEWNTSTQNEQIIRFPIPLHIMTNCCKMNPFMWEWLMVQRMCWEMKK